MNPSSPLLPTSHRRPPPPTLQISPASPQPLPTSQLTSPPYPTVSTSAKQKQPKHQRQQTLKNRQAASSPLKSQRQQQRQSQVAKEQQDPHQQNTELSNTCSPRWFCGECGTSETPVRRGGPSGPSTLCNACGLRLKKREKNAAASSPVTSSAASPTTGITTSGMTYTTSSSTVSSPTRGRRISTAAAAASSSGSSLGSATTVSRQRVRKPRQTYPSKRPSGTKRSTRRGSKQTLMKEDMSSSVSPTTSLALASTTCAKVDGHMDACHDNLTPANTKVCPESNSQTNSQIISRTSLTLKQAQVNNANAFDNKSNSDVNANIDPSEISNNKQHAPLFNSVVNANSKMIKTHHHGNQIHQLNVSPDGYIEGAKNNLLSHGDINASAHLSNELHKNEECPSLTDVSDGASNMATGESVRVQQGILGEEVVDGINGLSHTDSEPLFFIEDPMATEMERAMVELEHVSHDLSSSISMITEDEASDGNANSDIPVNVDASIRNAVSVNNRDVIAANINMLEASGYIPRSESMNGAIDSVMTPSTVGGISPIPATSESNPDVDNWSPMAYATGDTKSVYNETSVPTCARKNGDLNRVTLGIDEDFGKAKDKISNVNTAYENGLLRLQRMDVMLAEEDKSLIIEEESLRRRLDMIIQRKRFIRQRRRTLYEQASNVQHGGGVVVDHIELTREYEQYNGAQK